MLRKRILIVDDDRAQQRRLATLLEQQGYQVQLASSGEEALASADDTAPDLILSDVMMSGMDGYELARHIKGNRALKHIPIALHSSVFTDDRDRRLAEAIGVDAFFDKSIATSELLEQLRGLGLQSPTDTEGVNEHKFLRMRSSLLSEKIGTTHNELERARQRADTTAQQLQAITDAVPDLISEVGADWRYHYVNRAYETWHGRPKQEIVGKHIEEIMGREAIAKIRPKLERAMRGEKVDFEQRFDFAQKGRRDMWIRYLPYYDNAGSITGIHIIANDITERKAAEARLERTNHYYMVMLQINKLVSVAESEQELLNGACEIISQSGDFPLVWIGRVEHELDQRVRPIAQAGFEQDYLDGLHISWGDNEYGNGPTGKAIRLGVPQALEDIPNNPDYATWREAALAHGYASSIALPITIEGNTVEAALNIYASEPFAFSSYDTDLLEKLTGDISHGILALRLKQERQMIEESLRKANRAYRTLVQLKKALSQHHTESGLLHEVCTLLIDSGSYQLAWIGFAQNDGNKLIQPIASAGDTDNYLDEVVFSWGESRVGQSPSGLSIRKKKTVIINDTATVPGTSPWRAAATRRGYASIIAIPLKDRGRVFGCLTLYTDVTNAFYPEEVELLEELAGELAFGITALRQQDKHQRTAGELAYQRKLFEAVFRHIPDTMVITDTEHRIILCNSALIRDFGYFPEELLGQSPALLYEKESEFERQQLLRFHRNASDIHTPYNIAYRRKDGTTFQGETLGAAFRDKDKNLLGYITIVRNITERVAMENERSQLERQLQQAQKMETVGQLTGGIAHDFNNILASILGYTELAQLRGCHTDDKNSKQMRKYLHEIQSAGERGRDIISQLLAYSRTDSSEKQLIDLRPLIKETASLLKPTLSSRIRLTFDIGQPVPNIEADINQLHQVLMNLCVNARDAMEGHGSIEIGLHHVGKHEGVCSACGEQFSDDYLKLSVRDNGSGIPNAVLARMFNPFFTTKEIGKGSGMGLSMVHGIVHNHRGHIQVDTASTGTTFDILLPTSSYPQEEHSNEVPHIVVIDDEPMLVEFMTQLLLFNGYQVTGFTESDKALMALLQHQLPCDLVITDQVMPGISGSELATQLKHHRPDLPLLLCSANLSELDDDQAQQHGFMGMLSKPIESTRLISLVQKLLGNQQKPQVTRRIQ